MAEQHRKHVFKNSNEVTQRAVDIFYEEMRETILITFEDIMELNSINYISFRGSERNTWGRFLPKEVELLDFLRYCVFFTCLAGRFYRTHCTVLLDYIVPLICCLFPELNTVIGTWHKLRKAARILFLHKMKENIPLDVSNWNIVSDVRMFLNLDFSNDTSYSCSEGELKKGNLEQVGKKKKCIMIYHIFICPDYNKNIDKKSKLNSSKLDLLSNATADTQSLHDTSAVSGISAITASPSKSDMLSESSEEAHQLQKYDAKPENEQKCPKYDFENSQNQKKYETAYFKIINSEKLYALFDDKDDSESLRDRSVISESFPITGIPSESNTLAQSSMTEDDTDRWEKYGARQKNKHNFSKTKNEISEKQEIIQTANSEAVAFDGFSTFSNSTRKLQDMTLCSKMSTKSKPDVFSEIPDRDKSNCSENLLDYSERLPDYSERLPNYSERLPGYSERLPGYSERLPGYSERLPGYSERLPGCLERLSDFSDRLHDYSERFPSCSERLPDSSGGLSDDSDRLPVYSERMADYFERNCTIPKQELNDNSSNQNTYFSNRICNMSSVSGLFTAHVSSKRSEPPAESPGSSNDTQQWQKYGARPKHTKYYSNVCSNVSNRIKSDMTYKKSLSMENCDNILNSDDHFKGTFNLPKISEIPATPSSPNKSKLSVRSPEISDYTHEIQKCGEMPEGKQNCSNYYNNVLIKDEKCQMPNEMINTSSATSNMYNRINVQNYSLQLKYCQNKGASTVDEKYLNNGSSAYARKKDSLREFMGALYRLRSRTSNDYISHILNAEKFNVNSELPVLPLAEHTMSNTVQKFSLQFPVIKFPLNILEHTIEDNSDNKSLHENVDLQSLQARESILRSQMESFFKNVQYPFNQDESLPVIWEVIPSESPKCNIPDKENNYVPSSNNECSPLLFDRLGEEIDNSQISESDSYNQGAFLQEDQKIVPSARPKYSSPVKENDCVPFLNKQCSSLSFDRLAQELEKIQISEDSTGNEGLNSISSDKQQHSAPQILDSFSFRENPSEKKLLPDLLNLQKTNTIEMTSEKIHLFSNKEITVLDQCKKYLENLIEHNFPSERHDFCPQRFGFPSERNYCPPQKDDFSPGKHDTPFEINNLLPTVDETSLEPSENLQFPVYKTETNREKLSKDIGSSHFENATVKNNSLESPDDHLNCINDTEYPEGLFSVSDSENSGNESASNS